MVSRASIDCSSVWGHQKAVDNELWHSEDGIFALRCAIKVCEITSAGIMCEKWWRRNTFSFESPAGLWKIHVQMTVILKKIEIVFKKNLGKYSLFFNINDMNSWGHVLLLYQPGVEDVWCTLPYGAEFIITDTMCIFHIFIYITWKKWDICRQIR